MADWWTVGLTAVSVMVAVIALVIASRSNATAKVANTTSEKSNTIAEDAAASARRSADAAEAAERSQSAAEARAIERHDVAWSLRWEVPGNAVRELEDKGQWFIDRDLVLENYGPDVANDVRLIIKVGNQVWVKEWEKVIPERLERMVPVSDEETERRLGASERKDWLRGFTEDIAKEWCKKPKVEVSWSTALGAPVRREIELQQPFTSFRLL